MIERRTSTRVIEYPEWVNEGEGWRVTLQIYDDNDPGRRDDDGRPAWRGASVAVLDNEVVLRTNDRLRQLHVMSRDFASEMSDRAWAQLQEATEQLWAEQMLAATEGILQQLADADPATFGGAPLWIGAHVETRAMCFVCPCTPGVVLARRFYFEGVQYDIVITDLKGGPR